MGRRRPDRLDSARRLALVDELRRRGPGRWCAYCGCGVLRSDATLDHVVPVSKGGRTVLGNLVVACWPCNARKKDHVLGEVTVPHPHWYGLDKACLLCGERRKSSERSTVRVGRRPGDEGPASIGVESEVGPSRTGVVVSRKEGRPTLAGVRGQRLCAPPRSRPGVSSGLAHRPANGPT